MSSINDKFQNSLKKIESLSKRPTDDELLRLYSLYKKSINGDINIPKPGIFQLKEKKKWEAWNSVKGMNKEVAMQSYIDNVDYLISIYK